MTLKPQPLTERRITVVEIPPLPFEKLVNKYPSDPIEPLRCKKIVRHYFLYTLLDFVNEGDLNTTLMGVWRRTCYSRNIQQVQRLRLLWQNTADGVPRDFMWGWPLSLYLHYWTGTPIKQFKENTCVIDTKSNKFQEWRRLSFEDLVVSMTKIEHPISYANNLDFEWRCERRGLDPEVVREQYAARVESAALDQELPYIMGTLDWLNYIPTP